MADYKTTLSPEAEYGALAFDIFALENWNPNSPNSSTQQWRTLVKSWLALPPESRIKYYHTILPREDNPSLPWDQPSAEQIRTILAPNQSVQERNLSVSMNGAGGQAVGPVVWVRIWYGGGEEDEGRYRDMLGKAGVEVEGVLDDGGLYGFEKEGDEEGDGDGEEAWRKILYRLPQLVRTDVELDDPESEDYRRTGFDVEWFAQDGGEDGEDREGEGEDGIVSHPAFEAAFNAEVKIRSIVYVLDKEAIRGGFVKMKWLGEHGDVVWDSKVDPVEMGDSLRGALASGRFLHELVEQGYFLEYCWDGKNHHRSRNA